MAIRTEKMDVFWSVISVVSVVMMNLKGDISSDWVNSVPSTLFTFFSPCSNKRFANKLWYTFVADLYRVKRFIGKPFVYKPLKLIFTLATVIAVSFTGKGKEFSARKAIGGPTPDCAWWSIASGCFQTESSKYPSYVRLTDFILGSNFACA